MAGKGKDYLNLVDFSLLWNYFVNRFAIIFLLVMVGAFIHDIYDTMKNQTIINIKGIIISSIVGTAVIAAAIECFQPSIGVLVLICLMVGIWGYKLLDIIMNWNVVRSLLRNILKNSKNAVGEAIADTMDDLSKENKNEEESMKINDKEKENNSG